MEQRKQAQRQPVLEDTQIKLSEYIRCSLTDELSIVLAFLIYIPKRRKESRLFRGLDKNIQLRNMGVKMSYHAQLSLVHSELKLFMS